MSSGLYPDMRHTTLALLLATSISIGLHPRHADAAPCSRWVNQLEACANKLVAQSVCNNPIETWSDGQRQNYYNWIYSDDEERSCYKLISKVAPTRKGTATLAYIDDGFFYCTYDTDGDGHVYGTLANPTPQGKIDDYATFRSPILRDDNMLTHPVCDLVPEGPYTVYLDGHPIHATNPTRGGDFTQYQKSQKISTNKSRNSGVLRSDALKDRNGNPLIADINPLNTPLSYPEDDPSFSPDPTIPIGPLEDKDKRAEVDHLIPRKDIRGCPCGTNSPENALVISGKLNRKMSNRPDDPDRIKLLTAWVPGYVPPAAPNKNSSDALDDDSYDSDAEGAADPSATDEASADIGGCNSGHGTGPAAALVALGLVFARRRRAA
jgi:uncharacterized protein (TIGR03382 family)